LIALRERLAFAQPPVGVDVSPALIEIGRREIVKAGYEGRIELRVAAATQLPFDDARFDVALSSHVIKHLDDEALALTFREGARVLRPGGRFLLWEFKKSPLPRRSSSAPKPPVFRRPSSSAVKRRYARRWCGPAFPGSIDSGPESSSSLRCPAWRCWRHAE